jgi:hypothetical protein
MQMQVNSKKMAVLIPLLLKYSSPQGRSWDNPVNHNKSSHSCSLCLCWDRCQADQQAHRDPSQPVRSQSSFPRAPLLLASLVVKGGRRVPRGHSSSTHLRWLLSTHTHTHTHTRTRTRTCTHTPCLTEAVGVIACGSKDSTHKTILEDVEKILLKMQKNKH